MSQVGNADEHTRPTGLSNTLTQQPSQMGVNLTEVFLLDASTADNPSEKRAGEWKDVTDKAIKPVLRSVMSTLRKSGQPTGRPPDAQRKRKVTKLLSVPVWHLDATRLEAEPGHFGVHNGARFTLPLRSGLSRTWNPDTFWTSARDSSRWRSTIYVRFRDAESSRSAS